MKVNMPLAFYMPLEPMFAFLKKNGGRKVQKFFLNHFEYKNMTSK